MYYLSMLYLIICLMVEPKICKKKYLIVTIIPFILISFLRFGVGPDYFSYEFIYNTFDISSLGSFFQSYPELELGYKALMAVSKIMNINYHVFISFISIVGILIVFKLFYDYEDFMPESVLLYFGLFFLTWNLSGVRQGLAMFIITYFVMSFNNNLSWTKRALILASASLLHTSSLIVIPIYFASKMKWTRKKMLIIILAAITMSLLPYKELFIFLKDIPYIGKVYSYLPSASTNLFDFAGLMRISYCIILLVFYEVLAEKSEKVLLMTNYALISFSIYFVFKSSEILAARLSIYGYFLCIFLFPIIIDQVQKSTMIRKTVFALVICVFTSLYLVKDLKTLAFQAGYVDNFNTLNTVSIINSDRRDFNDYYNILTHRGEFYSGQFLFRDTASKVETDINPSDSFIAVYFPFEKAYGIINQEGKVVEEPTYSYRPVVYGNIVVEKSEGLYYKRDEYRYIGTRKYINQMDTFSIIEESIRSEIEIGKEWLTYEPFELKNIDSSLISTYIPLEFIENSHSFTFLNPSKYIIVEFNLYGINHHILLSENFEVLSKKVYSGISRFNPSGFAYASTPSGTDIIDLQGNVLWQEPVVLE